MFPEMGHNLSETESLMGMDSDLARVEIRIQNSIIETYANVVYPVIDWIDSKNRESDEDCPLIGLIG